jgi:hypothetical protein
VRKTNPNSPSIDSIRTLNSNFVFNLTEEEEQLKEVSHRIVEILQVAIRVILLRISGVSVEMLNAVVELSSHFQHTAKLMENGKRSENECGKEGISKS